MAAHGGPGGGWWSLQVRTLHPRRWLDGRGLRSLLVLLVLLLLLLLHVLLNVHLCLFRRVPLRQGGRQQLCRVGGRLPLLSLEGLLILLVHCLLCLLLRLLHLLVLLNAVLKTWVLDDGLGHGGVDAHRDGGLELALAFRPGVLLLDRRPRTRLPALEALSPPGKVARPAALAVPVPRGVLLHPAAAAAGSTAGPALAATAVAAVAVIVPATAGATVAPAAAATAVALVTAAAP
mmetsp:Transcript_97412/g.300297  ORF Transcript_97412/g.300297 Transcript_97412/m.300297 type:complete len:234 (-) Transcript_97412:42-743(-)